MLGWLELQESSACALSNLHKPNFAIIEIFEDSYDVSVMFVFKIGVTMSRVRIPIFLGAMLFVGPSWAGTGQSRVRDYIEDIRQKGERIINAQDGSSEHITTTFGKDWLGEGWADRDGWSRRALDGGLVDDKGISVLHWAANSGSAALVALILDAMHADDLQASLEHRIEGPICIAGFPVLIKTNNKRGPHFRDWPIGARVKWSPDGHYFAVPFNKGNKYEGLYIFTRDGRFKGKLPFDDACSNEFSLREDGTWSKESKNWSPDSSSILIKYGPASVVLWNSKNNRAFAATYPGLIKNVHWNYNGSSFFIEGSGGIKSWGIDGAERGIDFVVGDSDNSVQESCDGSLVCILQGKTISIYSRLKKTVIMNYVHDSPVNQSDWHSDGLHLLAWGSWDKAYLWNFGADRIDYKQLEHKGITKGYFRGSHIFTFGTFDEEDQKINNFRIWTMEGKAVLKLAKESALYFPSNDGDWVMIKYPAVNSEERYITHVFNLLTLNLVRLEEGSSLTWQNFDNRFIAQRSDFEWVVDRDFEKVARSDTGLMQLFGDEVELDAENLFDGPDQIRKINKKRKRRIFGKILTVSGRTLAKFRQDRHWNTLDLEEMIVSPDGARFIGVDGTRYMGSLWEISGGTVIDWGVRAVCAGGEIQLVELLLNLKECESLQGLCSSESLLHLCDAAARVKNYEPTRYAELCRLIGLIASKGGAPL